MNTPREFFICDETDNSGYSVREWSEKEAKRQYGSCNVFHVIEYSAYEAAMNRVEELEEQNKKLLEARELIKALKDGKTYNELRLEEQLKSAREVIQDLKGWATSYQMQTYSKGAVTSINKANDWLAEHGEMKDE